MSQRKILIIEDDVDEQVLIREALGDKNYEYKMVGTAVEGLEEALSWQPDVILLDLMLPQMSGLGFLRELKNLPEASHIPVIVRTILNDDDVAYASIEGGATAFLSKDCSTPELVAVVNDYTA